MLKERTQTTQYHYELTIGEWEFTIIKMTMEMPDGESFEDHYRIEYAWGCPLHPFEVLNALGVSVNGRRCTHMYDCCGSYYPQPARVLSDEWQVARVVQISQQNI